MTEAPSTVRDRPRSGPIRLLLLGSAPFLVAVALFVLLLATGSLSWAATLLLGLPLADIAARRSRVGRYVGRHTGLEASSYTLTAIWAGGLAALFAVGAPPGPVWIAAAAGAIAAAGAAVERVAWARFPSELDGRALPSTDRARRRFRWFDRSSERYVGLESAVLAAMVLFQLVTTGLLVVDPSGGLAVGGAAVFLGLLAARALFSAATIALRAQRGDKVLRETIGRDVAALQPELLVHFSGSIRALYQLDQWMPHIISSGHAVLLVVRERPTFDAVAGRWAVPVVFVDQFVDLDLVVPPTAKVAFYVNTETSNNHLIRFSDLTHVQLHHGDSDKQPSTGKTMRLYDHHVVAGPAAVARLERAGAVSGSADVSMVGRPVTDRLLAGPLDNPTPTVLYAPTWEGYHVDSVVSSVGTMAHDVVRNTPADVVLMVQLHPLTGTADGRLRAVVRSLRALVESRGSAGDFIEPQSGQDLIDSMNRADALICDVSSVLVDFLATDRPIAVCDVRDIGADELHRRYPSTAAAHVLSPGLGELAGVIDAALHRDDMEKERRAARDRLLAVVDGSEQAFHQAIDALLAATAGDDRTAGEANLRSQG